MKSYKVLQELIAIDSPSGFTKKACQYIFDLLSSYGYSPEFTNKGAVKCALGDQPTLCIAGHVDTLGAIVSNIKSDGTLEFSKIGGLTLPVIEGDYLRVYTLEDKVYRGTFLINNPSTHANGEMETTKRRTKNMHIRLDEVVATKKEVEDLGIQNGDIVCVNPRYKHLPSGYIKSKYLDNKAGCFVLLEMARRFKETNQTVPVELFFSNFEEVGHGGTCGYASTIQELLVIDMGVLGSNLEGDELSCSICAKDSSGPYDYEMRKKLIQLAKEKNIPYKVDVYPYYGSDGSAALRAGNDFRVALIGPGVAASHGSERTHEKGIRATLDLSMVYIESLQRSS